MNFGQRLAALFNIYPDEERLRARVRDVVELHSRVQQLEQAAS